jgi:hypothetical protein
VGSARDEDRPAHDGDLGMLLRLLADGRLRPLVRPVGFDDVVRAHTEIDAGAVCRIDNILSIGFPQALRSYGALNSMPDLGLRGEQRSGAAPVIRSVQTPPARD